MCCPVGFNEEFIVVLSGKSLELTSKMTKNQKFSISLKFYGFFSKFLTETDNWNVEKSPQDKIVLFSMLRKENAVFQTKTVRN